MNRRDELKPILKLHFKKVGEHATHVSCAVDKAIDTSFDPKLDHLVAVDVEINDAIKHLNEVKDYIAQMRKEVAKS